jgi:hypothetical protein
MDTSWQELRRRAEHWVEQLWPAQDCRSLVFRLLADLQPAAGRAGAGPDRLRSRDPGARGVAERSAQSCTAARPAPGSTLQARGNAWRRAVPPRRAGGSRAPQRVDFALWAEPSATHTLREFFALEARLGPGARVLIDEAALPGARLALRPCRQGKLLVPYLLASPVWRVAAHPRVGESMVSAVHDRVGARADASYEDPSYVARWLAQRGGALRPIS